MCMGRITDEMQCASYSGAAAHDSPLFAEQFAPGLVSDAAKTDHASADAPRGERVFVHERRYVGVPPVVTGVGPLDENRTATR